MYEFSAREDKGYLLEVDVSYPQELHHEHNDLPFMCERMEINGVEKLVPNLRDKKNYVIHIQVLNQALKHELILDRIQSIAMVKDLHRFQHSTKNGSYQRFREGFFQIDK